MAAVDLLIDGLEHVRGARRGQGTRRARESALPTCRTNSRS
ncbi:hypothetical protein [Brachybacterium tyrofermentans]|uniref:Uncharacterized protein n=1 Tax=Brachybacterium tyrofermentans TaxID=47848 RepID=A0ABW0FD40_9MICO